MVAQWLKDPALSLLWHRFNPGTGNCHMPRMQPKKNSYGHELIYMYVCIHIHTHIYMCFVHKCRHVCMIQE